MLKKLVDRWRQDSKERFSPEPLIDRVPIVRPSWEDFFLGLAFCVKERSVDGNTRHGSVIVSQDNNILSVGYNSFPRGMKDNELPNTRPKKYPLICHSEENAISNCLISPRMLPSGAAKIFVSGFPCHICSKLLYQNGVMEFCIADRAGYHNGGEDESKVLQLLEKQCGVKVNVLSLKNDRGEGRLNWLKKVVDELQESGYIDR